ncbi:hypothetical protein G5C51_18590 [Streptomyces sp. A7024]|uniref:Integral membrane protein n=1 Tax=Streptomyces coryli TaxID=1128680 RepID=A0A6G4U0Y9_9ACTN|nr:hypothetical protein [Streptomyces coryli]NGN65895.1 hypothetical protein [Streptomyces coryli]
MALETGKAAGDPAVPAQPGGGARCSLELLVHGVGGTTPEEMLDDPRTVLITGDHTAGIYRRAVDEKAEEQPQNGQRPVPEAYCWSNLTSGNGARALWLVLLPFMVVNLAHWVRPAAPAKSAAQRLYDVAVRLLALSLTVQFVAAAVEVTVDLMAWQCAGSAHCVAGKSWLSFMSAESGGWWGEPGRRLAVGALIPALIAALLWWLSHRTWSAYESASPPPRTGPATPEKDGDRPVLSLPGFWYGRRLVARLRAAHTAAALLIIASALLAATAAEDSGVLAAVGRVLIGLTAVGWVAVLAVVCRRGRSEAEMEELDGDRWAVRILPGGAIAVLAATLVHTAWTRPGWAEGGRLPGTSFFGGVAVAQGVLIAALAVAAFVLQRQSEGRSPVLGGMAGPVVALLAGALGWVYSGGLAQRMGDWLDRGATPGDPGSIPGPPVVLSWQATVIPLILAVLILLAVGAGIRLWRVKRKVFGEIPGIYPDDAEHDRLSTPRSRSIAGAVARADLTDAAPRMLAVLAVANLVLSGGAVAGAWITGAVPGRAAEDAPGVVPACAATGQALGSWLVGALLILLLTTGRRAYKDASARRTIGILWDVGTFWPRAAHTFAPPCYAERAVPDLTWRMCTWTDRHKGRLVLSGHSQGSVLSAAAIWQLDPTVRSKVALLTYGSPLTRLYGRWFPAYFGSAQLTALHKDLATWRNLYRPTDPIGGPIDLEDGEGTDIDRPALRDPVCYGRTPEHPLPAPINGHSDYPTDPAFAEERTWLLRRLAGGKTVPAQPGKSSG